MIQSVREEMRDMFSELRLESAELKDSIAAMQGQQANLGALGWITSFRVSIICRGVLRFCFLIIIIVFFLTF